MTSRRVATGIRARIGIGARVAVAVLALAPYAFTGPARAQNDEALLQRIERLERELEELKVLLKVREQAKEERSAPAAEPISKEARKPVDSPVTGASRVPEHKHAAKRSNTIWHLSGYADAGFIVSDTDRNDSFTAGKFNPAFHFQYKDWLLFESELEMTVDDEGETELELEYSQLDFLLHDSVTLVVGKFLSPVGQFQERLHPSWINKLPNAPAGFGHDGAQPEGDVGVQLRGGIPLGRTLLTYVIMAGNGPRLGHEGGVAFEGFGGDDNGNKSLGGRIGFLPLPYLEIGASYLTAKVDGEEGLGAVEPTRADVDLWGIDAAYTRGSWDVRAEYLNVARDGLFSASEEEAIVSFLPKFRLKAWYAQIAYRLPKIGNASFLQNFEPVFRYGEFSIDGSEELEEEAAENRFNFGLNYWLAPSAVIKGSVERRNFKGPEHDTRFEFQFSYGF